MVELPQYRAISRLAMTKPDEKNVNCDVHIRLLEELRLFAQRHGMVRKRLVAAALHHLVANADLGDLQVMLANLNDWEERGRPELKPPPPQSSNGGNSGSPTTRRSRATG